MGHSKKRCLILNPTPSWGNIPNVVLYGCALRSTSDVFGTSITIVDQNEKEITTFQVAEKSGFGYENIGKIRIKREQFPITIKCHISCNKKFETRQESNVQIGQTESGKITSYQSTIFCNDNADDPNADHDFNDFVLIWQLFQSSHD